MTPNIIKKVFTYEYSNKIENRMRRFFAPGILATTLLMVYSFPASAATITGQISVPSGTGIGGIQICAYNASPYVFKCVVSDQAGAYSITNLNTGSYRIDVQPWGIPSLPVPNSFSIIGLIPNLNITGDITQNATLPIAIVSGKVKSQISVGIPNATVSTNNGNNTSWSSNGTTYSSKSTVTTASDGSFSMPVLKHNGYSVTVKSTDTAYTPLTVSGMDFTSDTTANFTLDSSYTLSGTVKVDPLVSTSGIGNLQVCIYQASPYVYKCGVSDSTGKYSIQGIPSGTYRLDVKPQAALTGTTVPFANFSIVGIVPSIAVSGITSRDIILPHVVVSGHITTMGGTPLPGSTFTVNKGQNCQWTSGQTTYSNNVLITADPTGAYAILMLPYDKYPLSITPPYVPPPSVSPYYPRTDDQFSVLANTVFNAKLNTVPSYKLTVAVPLGYVWTGTTSSPDGIIKCGNDGKVAIGTKCTAYFDVGSQIVINGASGTPYCPTCSYNWQGACHGITPGQCTFTMPSTSTSVDLVAVKSQIQVNINFPLDGGGSVNANPTTEFGIAACMASLTQPCTGGYVSTELPIKLFATKDATSAFSGFTGDCLFDSVTGACTVSADYPNSSLVKNISANFVRTYKAASIGNTSYATFPDAYLAASDGDTIRLVEGVHYGPYTLDRNITVTLSGGYDTLFSSVTSETTIQGGLILLTGAAVIDQIVLN